MQQSNSCTARGYDTASTCHAGEAPAMTQQLVLVLLLVVVVLLVLLALTSGLAGASVNLSQQSPFWCLCTSGSKQVSSGQKVKALHGKSL
jgi:hypothetical protein